MKIFAVGLNHGKTPVNIRGRLAVSASQLPEALAVLHANVTPGVILSTCNRTEVYTIGHHEDETVPPVVGFLNARANLTEKEQTQYVYVYQGESAVRHLFRVSSGLDSMIVGEHEILGQVRNAQDEAKRTGKIPLPLLNLFQSAIRAGRRVRALTGISKNALSISSMAVDLAVKVVGDISESKIVIVGAGEAGRKVAKRVQERGAAQLVVVSRDPERGISLAKMLQGVWSPMDRLDLELIDSKILICCSGAPHSIVKYERLKKVMEERSGMPLVIIDIAVPPDVDPRVKQLRNVFLYDIDELNKACSFNQQKRWNEFPVAEKVINSEVDRFNEYWKTLEIRPLISSLVQKADHIRQTQLELTLKKIKNLSEKESAYLEAMTKSMIRKILHDPIQRIKCDGPKRNQYIQIMSDLFDLDGCDYR
jgi:glutamyl-tRNA reductase